MQAQIIKKTKHIFTGFSYSRNMTVHPMHKYKAIILPMAFIIMKHDISFKEIN
jgi:hypothetical protein